jgi:hypothetical protein
MVKSGQVVDFEMSCSGDTSAHLFSGVIIEEKSRTGCYFNERMSCKIVCWPYPSRK